MFTNLFSTPPWPDAILYDTVARDFAQTGLFRYKIWGDFDPTYMAANFNNGPLYPALHLALLKLFGSTDHRLLVILNVIFLIASLWNVGRALQFKGRQWVLGLIVVCNPLVLNYIGVARPEFLNIFFFTCIWRLLSPLPMGEGQGEGAAYWRPLCAGFCLGLAALNHQFSIFFTIPIAYLLYATQSQWRGRLTHAALLTLGTLVSFGPYLYYIAQHGSDFSFQLLHNQIGESASTGLTVFLRSFVTPLFYPSISVFTLTGQVPRWVLDGLPIAMVLAIVALIAKWRRHAPLSPTTRAALVIWLAMNVGCAVTTYSPYVTFFFAVFVAALLRDVFPNVPKALRIGISIAALLGIGHQVVVSMWVDKALFRWEDYQAAAACVAEQLPQQAKVYVMAYPDPSNALINQRPDLDVRRYIDFPQYCTAWEDIVRTQPFVVVSGDGNFLNRFDHGGALRQDIAQGRVAPHNCTVGTTQFIIYSYPQRP
jgi:hypothetical protein